MYAPAYLTLENSAFYPHGVHVFRMIQQTAIISPQNTHPQVQHNVDLLLKQLTSVGRDIPDTKVIGHKFSTSDRILGRHNNASLRQNGSRV